MVPKRMEISILECAPPSPPSNSTLALRSGVPSPSFLSSPCLLVFAHRNSQVDIAPLSFRLFRRLRAQHRLGILIAVDVAAG